MKAIGILMSLMCVAVVCQANSYQFVRCVKVNADAAYTTVGKDQAVLNCIDRFHQELTYKECLDTRNDVTFAPTAAEISWKCVQHKTSPSLKINFQQCLDAVRDYPGTTIGSDKLYLKCMDSFLAKMSIDECSRAADDDLITWLPTIKSAHKKCTQLVPK